VAKCEQVCGVGQPDWRIGRAHRQEAWYSATANRGIDRLPSVGRQTVPGRGGGAEMAGAPTRSGRLVPQRWPQPGQKQSNTLFSLELIFGGANSITRARLLGGLITFPLMPR
jgi:hypothetical protein